MATSTQTQQILLQMKKAKEQMEAKRNAFFTQARALHQQQQQEKIRAQQERIAKLRRGK